MELTAKPVGAVNTDNSNSLIGSPINWAKQGEKEAKEEKKRRAGYIECFTTRASCPENAQVFVGKGHTGDVLVLCVPSYFHNKKKKAPRSVLGFSRRDSPRLGSTSNRRPRRGTKTSRRRRRSRRRVTRPNEGGAEKARREHEKKE